jgi:hypothetical protein
LCQSVIFQERELVHAGRKTGPVALFQGDGPAFLGLSIGG